MKGELLFKVNKMEIQEYLDEINKIQTNIHYFLDDTIDAEENFQNLMTLFDDQNIHHDKFKLKLILHMIVEISNNYHRFHNFFSKIEQILLAFKKEIIDFYPNWEIFNIFKSNKRVLLFIIKENIIKIDEYIIKALNNDKYISDQYHFYLAPEMKPYINKKNCLKYELIMNQLENIPKNFSEKRETGENDNIICEVIRNDLISEFIKYKIDNLNCRIEHSIFETNSFLLKNKPTLIEYAAFFGSIQIFKYLFSKNVILTPSLWMHAIHGNNIEIIHILEENNIKPNSGSYKKCLEESFKCHHNDIAYYITTNYFQCLDLESISTYTLKYYNFSFIEKRTINEFTFIELCKFDYYIFVNILLKNKDIDINEEIQEKN